VYNAWLCGVRFLTDNFTIYEIAKILYFSLKVIQKNKIQKFGGANYLLQTSK
jgi:hypothetical protein